MGLFGVKDDAWYWRLFFFVSGVGHHSWVCLSIALSENRTDKGQSQRHGFFNQGVQRKNSKKQKEHIRCWKIICRAIFFWWFIWVTLNTNGRQQHQQKQRSAKLLGSERNMEPRFQTSFRCYNAVAVVYAFFKRKQLVFFNQ